MDPLCRSLHIAPIRPIIHIHHRLDKADSDKLLGQNDDWCNPTLNMQSSLNKLLCEDIPSTLYDFYGGERKWVICRFDGRTQTEKQRNMISMASFLEWEQQYVASTFLLLSIITDSCSSPYRKMIMRIHALQNKALMDTCTYGVFTFCVIIIKSLHSFNSLTKLIDRLSAYIW